MAVDQAPETQSLSLLDLILSGDLGGQIIIGILFVLLAVTIYIYFERF
ncbi:MAG: MotA/TolQ/ExbB proton channel family protein, partial [Flavobacteriaceae bacterium]|nr:MotA/TolQ/ExbB proton channel family protein [Flavobacteriaceae bacterium]